jgi:hypothetical protein
MAPPLLAAFARVAILFSFGLRVPAAIPITMRLAKISRLYSPARVLGYQFEHVRRVEPCERESSSKPGVSSGA